MVVLHSVMIWTVWLSAPFFIGLPALGIDLPPGELLLATYTVTVFAALAVAAPSAPGFFGVYHFACREALALFGVSSASRGRLRHRGAHELLAPGHRSGSVDRDPLRNPDE